MKLSTWLSSSLPVFLFRLTILTSAILFLFTGCPNRFEHPFYIAARLDAVSVENVGVTTLNAQCLSGEQLLGGGYVLPDLNEPMGSNFAVLANYPSSPNTWTVIVDHADTPTAKFAAGSMVMAVAYCFTTPNYPLGIVTATGTNQGAGVPFFNVTAECPSGSVLTGGGYKTEATNNLVGLYNANVMMSAPLFDTNSQATGWQVGLAYVVNEMIPTTTVYALCSTQNLVADKVVVAPLDLTKLGAAFDWRENEARCPVTDFTTGGGYSLVGDALIPHPVSYSDSRDQYTAWRFRVLYGYQTTSYKFRPCDPTTNPNCATISSIAACVKIPNIPFVKVKIIKPTNNESFDAPTKVAPNLWNTVPITFVAEATDEDGNPLDGDSVRWYRDGIPFGTGQTFVASLPVPSSNSVYDFAPYTKFVIKVVATGKSTQAQDQIEIYTGQIP
jgi:hypothetical protein